MKKGAEKKRGICGFLRKKTTAMGWILTGILLMIGCYVVYLGKELIRLREQLGMDAGVQTRNAVVTTIPMVILIIILLDIFLIRLRRRVVEKVTTPLSQLDEAMDQLAEGNLGVGLEYGTEDEFTHIMKNMNRVTGELKKYVSNASGILNELSSKNMDVETEQEYLGDFVQIQQAVAAIAENMNRTLTEIKASYEQIRNGANTLAGTAQFIASGAEGQREHIGLLTEQVEKVSASVHDNASAVQEVESLTHAAKQRVLDGESKMGELAEAMEQIHTESAEIKKIIGVIAGIAEQTNLLALNASIEAARAGEHGRGFSVVASEISGLAGSCTEASKDIDEMIQKSMGSVARGVSLSGETSQMIQGISGMMEGVEEHIVKIADTSKRQDEYLQRMLASSQEIKTITEQNSAQAQECSALSEELLATVEEVMGSMEEYRLKKE